MEVRQKLVAKVLGTALEKVVARGFLFVGLVLDDWARGFVCQA